MEKRKGIENKELYDCSVKIIIADKKETTIVICRLESKPIIVDLNKMTVDELDTDNESNT